MGHCTPNLLLNRLHRTDLVLHAGLWLGDILHVARPADLLQVAPANSAPPATIALIFTQPLQGGLTTASSSSSTA